MKTLDFIFLLGLSSSLLSASPSDKETPLKEIREIGEKSSTQLLKTLGKNMKQHMKSGGALEALDFCTNQAYTLTESVNAKLPKGVSVKRISAKYRNPTNQPSADELAVLEIFENMKKANIVLPKALVQKRQDHLYKYYKPLVIEKKVCLKCHGHNINAEVKKEIVNRYPQDSAINYKLHDLRGAIVVEIDKRVKQ
ncbi:MAG: DUF3365 domain-containing protein [Sulfurimonas sp.]|nr:DUF3365 domain-containing protein [Sulfurimonas sp.]